MSIHIIIDGYNVIRGSDRLNILHQQDIQLGREALLDDLSVYKRLRARKITVVFDGAGAPFGMQDTDRVKGITVKFSDKGESADMVIKRMAAREKEKALVVSSDRDLTHSVETFGATSIDSAEFENRIAMTITTGTGKMIDDGSEGWIPTTRKKGPSRRLSKKARRARRKIKKL